MYIYTTFVVLPNISPHRFFFSVSVETRIAVCTLFRKTKRKKQNETNKQTSQKTSKKLSRAMIDSECTDLSGSVQTLYKGIGVAMESSTASIPIATFVFRVRLFTYAYYGIVEPAI